MSFWNRKKENCSGTDSSADKTAEQANAGAARVKILGSGCAKCNQLEANTLEAMALLGMEPFVDHVTDFIQIAAYGVMSTPALVIDNKLLSSGRVLSVSEIENLLRAYR